MSPRGNVAVITGAGSAMGPAMGPATAFQPGRPLRPWLLRIGTNEALNWLRSRRREREHVLGSEASDVAFEQLLGGRTPRTPPPARSVVVADVVPARLDTALAVGADAVINSAAENVVARLTELHGTAATAMALLAPRVVRCLDGEPVPGGRRHLGRGNGATRA